MVPPRAREPMISPTAACWAGVSRPDPIPATNEVTWSYADEMVNAFFTAFMGNAQPLPNGNVHITESATGRLFEVTRAGEVVWEYVIPWFAEYPDAAARRTGPGRLNSVFQTWRYAADQIPWLAA